MKYNSILQYGGTWSKSDISLLDFFHPETDYYIYVSKPHFINMIGEEIYVKVNDNIYYCLIVNSVSLKIIDRKLVNNKKVLIEDTIFMYYHLNGIFSNDLITKNNVIELRNIINQQNIKSIEYNYKYDNNKQTNQFSINLSEIFLGNMFDNNIIDIKFFEQKTTKYKKEIEEIFFDYEIILSKITNQYYINVYSLTSIKNDIIVVVTYKNYIIEEIEKPQWDFLICFNETETVALEDLSIKDGQTSREKVKYEIFANNRDEENIIFDGNEESNINIKFNDKKKNIRKIKFSILNNDKFSSNNDEMIPKLNLLSNIKYIVINTKKTFNFIKINQTQKYDIVYLNNVEKIIPSNYEEVNNFYVYENHNINDIDETINENQLLTYNNKVIPWINLIP